MFSCKENTRGTGIRANVVLILDRLARSKPEQVPTIVLVSPRAAAVLMAPVSQTRLAVDNVTATELVPLKNSGPLIVTSCIAYHALVTLWDLQNSP